MKTIINRALFENVDRNSGSLSVLSTIFHRFTEPGQYSGSISKGGREVGYFSLDVREPVTDATSNEGSMTSYQIASCDVPPMQANVDLKELESSVRCARQEEIGLRYSILTGGVVQFHVPSGSGGYSIKITKTNKKAEQKVVMDSNELGSDDLFTTLVLRPGTYLITNEITKAKAKLVVAYPEEGRMPRSPAPVELECSKDAITPSSVRIVPAQPLLFRFKVRSRIAIAIKEPDDGPKKVQPSGMKTPKRTKAGGIAGVSSKTKEGKPALRRESYPAGFPREE